MLGSEQQKEEKILIFELNWMGDILFSVPFLRALRDRLSRAYISCAVVPRYSQMLTNNKWVNDVHVLNDSRGINSLAEKIAFTRLIAREKYDTAFFLKTSRSKVLMAQMAGIKRRIGFDDKDAPLTDVIESPSEDMHRVERILSILAPLEIKTIDGSYEYTPSDDDKEKATALLRASEGGLNPVIVLNPGGNWEAKRWPLEYFKELARLLASEFPEMEIAITGAEKDTERCEEIIRSLDTVKAYSLAGRTSIKVLAGVFSKSRLVVSADSGPLHLASSCGVPTISLYGPTLPKLTGPRGRGTNIVISREKEIDCALPCYEEKCPKNFECMRKITPDTVMDACRRELSKGF